MEQKFGKNSIDIEALREFCEREGKMVEYRKGERNTRGLERCVTWNDVLRSPSCCIQT